MKYLKLNNNYMLPIQGLGASAIYGDRTNPDVESICKMQYEIYRYALESGKCKLFDSSGAYGHNEEILGNALKDSKVNRKDIFLMTKIANRQQDKLHVRQALEHSLKLLNTDYVDFYLIHWPQTETFIETYKQMEKLYAEGLVKGIGVCNFNKHHLEELMRKTEIIPVINQFEIHPLFTQDALVNYCYANDIQPIAYTPVGRMHDCLIKSKPIFELSKKYKKSSVQIILRWHYQLGRVAIPRTLSKQHFDEIFSIDQFELTKKEMCWISSLNENIRLRYNPDTCDFSRL